jgi:hypothetical protein
MINNHECSIGIDLEEVGYDQFEDTILPFTWSD